MYTHIIKAPATIVKYTNTMEQCQYLPLVQHMYLYLYVGMCTKQPITYVWKYSVSFPFIIKYIFIRYASRIPSIMLFLILNFCGPTDSTFPLFTHISDIFQSLADISSLTR